MKAFLCFAHRFILAFYLLLMLLSSTKLCCCYPLSLNILDFVRTNAWLKLHRQFWLGIVELLSLPPFSYTDCKVQWWINGDVRSNNSIVRKPNTCYWRRFWLLEFSIALSGIFLLYTERHLPIHKFYSEKNEFESIVKDSAVTEKSQHQNATMALKKSWC